MKEKHHDIERDSSTPSSYQEMSETQNWTMVQQNGITSVPSSNETSRIIKGDAPYVAGSSLIGMNQEMMRENGGPTSHTQIETRKQTYYKSGVERTLEQNQNVDAFDRSRKISNTSEASRGGYRGGERFERTSEVRESARSNQSFQKPRLANVMVSQSKYPESSFNNSYPKDHAYLPERNNSTRVTQTSVYKKTTTSQPYKIPEEDYSGIQMYREDERYSRRAPARTPSNVSQSHASLHRLKDGQVRNLTERFETTEVSTGDPSVTSRSAVENELREQIAERRSYQRSDPVPSSQRVSRDSQILQDYDNPSTNWQGKSGKGTIETRLNRIKKVGAVSVFPD